MKIVFIGNGLKDTDSFPHPNQGGPVQTWGLAIALAKGKNEIYLIRRGINIKNEHLQGVTLVNICFKGFEDLFHLKYLSYSYTLIRIVSSLIFSLKSLTIVRKLDPDIIIVSSMYSGFFPSFLNRKVLYIMHVPDRLDIYHVFESINILKYFFLKIKRKLENIIINNVDYVITLNEYSKKVLQKELGDKVLKIGNGVDKNNDLIIDKNIILYAGRFDKNKNVISLLKAYNKIYDNYKSYSLILVGDGYELTMLKNYVRGNQLLDKVKIISWIPRNELLSLIRNCSIFVLPSYFEMFPVVLLEAMSCSKPVIAKKNIGTCDLITDGYNGYLYDTEDQLVTYMSYLLNNSDKRMELGINAKNFVEQNYTFTAIANNYEKLFNKFKER